MLNSFILTTENCRSDLQLDFIGLITSMIKLPCEKHKRNEEKTVPLLKSERFSQGRKFILF